MDADGKVLVALDEAGGAAAARELLALGAESVVVHFLQPADLHSGANRHAPRRSCGTLWPNGYVMQATRSLAGVPRVRARRDGGGQRCGSSWRCIATSKRLQKELAGAAARASWSSCRATAARSRRARHRARGRDGDVGPGLGRHRRGSDGAAGRNAPRPVRRRRHLRHGRHVERRRHGPRRPALGVERPRASSTQC